MFCVDRLTSCDLIEARPEVVGGCFWCDRMKIDIFRLPKEEKEKELEEKNS